jgi:hypothetical protein
MLSYHIYNSQTKSLPFPPSKVISTQYYIGIKLILKNFMHFLKLFLCNGDRLILERDGLYHVLWCFWLLVWPFTLLLNPCDAHSWLMWIPISFPIVGVFKIHLELAPISLPAIWVARNNLNWFDNASIYRLIWLALLLCSTHCSYHLLCRSAIDSWISRWRPCNLSSNLLQCYSTIFTLLFSTILSQDLLQAQDRLWYQLLS